MVWRIQQKMKKIRQTFLYEIKYNEFIAQISDENI